MKTPGIWVTIGKKGFKTEDLKRLVTYNDISGIRLNTGRSTFSWIYEAIRVLKESGYPLENVLLDIGNKKPRIRLKNKDGFKLDVGTQIEISNNEQGDGDAWLAEPLFFKEVKKGDIIYFGDGEIETTAIDVSPERIVLSSLNRGLLSEAISIGIKGKSFFDFCISEEEIKEVNTLLQSYPVRLILSFVHNAENIRWARKIFPAAVSIIPKIETAEAYYSIMKILEEADCIFVGRGDLALSLGIERIGIAQKTLLDKAKQFGCKVSLGTGTLDSLQWSETPLRAEVSDITNSCLNYVDYIALTSETAGSTTPFKALDYLVKILDYIKTIA